MSTHPTREHDRRRRWRTQIQADVLAVIAAGGTLGATARFKIAEALPVRQGQFPWATFWTNVSGCFVLGFVLVVLLERFPPTRYLRPFLATGVIGAFTTMSTFTVETAILVKDGHAVVGMVYGLGTFSAGLAVVYAGTVAGRLFPRSTIGGSR